MRNIMFAILILLTVDASGNEVELLDGESVLITLQPGFSTSLKFDKPPKTLGLGNQDLIKAEFVAQEVLLKPLQESGRTNLFVYLSNGERFDFRLKIGKASRFGYVIHREYKEDKSIQERAEVSLGGLVASPVAVSKLRHQIKVGGLVLQLKALQRYDAPELLRIDFEIGNSSRKSEQISFQSLKVTQDGKVVPLNMVYFPRPNIEPKQRLRGFLEIKGHPPNWRDELVLGLSEERIRISLKEVSRE